MLTNPNDWAGQELIAQLVAQGVTYFCIAPGSRSTPLATAAARNPDAELFVHFDERGVGFHALGYAKATGKPAAIIVTSGTALGNLYPAVMEASYSHIPLILLTADRPPELQDVAANQTCDQARFFGSFVRYSFALPPPSQDLPKRILATTVAQAVLRSSSGPVHLNCPFREPLLGKETPPFHFETPCLFGDTEQMPTESTLNLWADILSQTKKGAIVVGQLSSPYSYQPLFDLAERLRWPILSDILSGVRCHGRRPSVIRYWESLLQTRAFPSPDLTLYLGEQSVSKQLPHWLSSPVLHVSRYEERCDPSHKVTQRLVADPLQFCEKIVTKLEPCSDGWLPEWKKKEEEIHDRIEGFFSRFSSLTEPGLFSLIPQTDSALFIANSMPIRYANRFYFPERPTGKIYANRGLSGIDGNIATCAGLAKNGPVIAIIGDQTALHDLNSLAMLRDTPHPVTLFILNNQGGGIFSFVPVPQEPGISEKVFAAAHSYTFEKIVKGFGLSYLHTQDLAEITGCCGKRMVVELSTSRVENLTLHKELEQWLSFSTVS